MSAARARARGRRSSAPAGPWRRAMAFESAFRGSPAARARRMRASTASSSSLAAVASPAAPSTTTVISPRTSPRAPNARRELVAACRGATSSWSFVSSRATAGPPGAEHVRGGARAIRAMRCGASNHTSVSARSRSDSRSRRALSLAGGQEARETCGERPAGPRRPARRPARTGPARRRPENPAAAAASTRRAPGSESAGMPASETSATVSPRPRPREQLLDARLLARAPGRRCAARRGGSAPRASR